MSEEASKEWTDLLSKTGEQKMDALRYEQANKNAHEDKIENMGRDDSYVHDQQQTKNAYETAEATENRAAMAAARLQKLHRLRPDLVEGPATEACRFLGPKGCKENLASAVGSEHTAVTTAIRLLRHGRAGSLCDQVGRTRCHESLRDAKLNGHVGIRRQRV